MQLSYADNLYAVGYIRGHVRSHHLLIYLPLTRMLKRFLSVRMSLHVYVDNDV